MGWIFGLGISLIVVISGLMMYCLYQLVLIDAKNRGLKKPKFWAVLAAGSQNGSGLFWYLVKRRHTVATLNPQEVQQVLQLKKKIYLLLTMDVMALTFSLVAMFKLK